MGRLKPSREMLFGVMGAAILAGVVCTGLYIVRKDAVALVICGVCIVVYSVALATLFAIMRVSARADEWSGTREGDTKAIPGETPEQYAQRLQANGMSAAEASKVMRRFQFERGDREDDR